MLISLIFAIWYASTADPVTQCVQISQGSWQLAGCDRAAPLAADKSTSTMLEVCDKMISQCAAGN